MVQQGKRLETVAIKNKCCWNYWSTLRYNNKLFKLHNVLLAFFRLPCISVATDFQLRYFVNYCFMACDTTFVRQMQRREIKYMQPVDSGM